MAVSWTKVSNEVVRLCEDLIAEFHPHLQEARIGLIFRSEAPKSNGKETWGQASTVNDKTNALLPDNEKLDFLIWLAHDVWVDLTTHQQRALLDHELCHCKGEWGGYRTMGHDVEEFACIIERYGLWNPSLHYVARAFEQRTIPGIVESLRRDGAVLSVNPDRVPA
jgi:hypothetical protein